MRGGIAGGICARGSYVYLPGQTFGEEDNLTRWLRRIGTRVVPWKLSFWDNMPSSVRDGKQQHLNVGCFGRLDIPGVVSGPLKAEFEVRAAAAAVTPPSPPPLRSERAPTRGDSESSERDGGRRPRGAAAMAGHGVVQERERERSRAFVSRPSSARPAADDEPTATATPRDDLDA